MKTPKRDARPIWLLGDNIAHSLSPSLHNAALCAMGHAPRYALRPCTSGELAAVLDEAAASCAGINVTAPHKLAVAARFADVLDERARFVGAVNTVAFAHGRARVATNTDVEGLRTAWRRAAVDPRGRTAAIFGAGGAARAAVVALAESGAGRVAIHARRREAAAALVSHAAHVGLDAFVAERAHDASFAIVAASSVDDPDAAVRRRIAQPGIVHDLRYGPTTHGVRSAALRAGHLFIDGTSMLVGQALAALAVFLDASLPVEASRAMSAAVTHTRSSGV